CPTRALIPQAPALWQRAPELEPTGNRRLPAPRLLRPPRNRRCVECPDTSCPDSRDQRSLSRTENLLLLFLGLRDDGVDDDHVPPAHPLPFPARGNIADPDPLMQHQLADVDLDILGNIPRQALDLDFAPDEFENSPLLLDAFRLAFHHHRNRHLNRTVHGDAVEIRMQHLMGHRIELVVLHQDPRVVLTGELQRNQRIGAGLRVQDPQQCLGIDADWPGFLRSALTRRAIKDRGHTPVAARPPRFVLAKRVANRCFEYCFHLWVSLLTLLWAPRPRPVFELSYTNNADPDASA